MKGYIDNVQIWQCTWIFRKWKTVKSLCKNERVFTQKVETQLFLVDQCLLICPLAQMLLLQNIFAAHVFSRRYLVYISHLNAFVCPANSICFLQLTYFEKQWDERRDSSLQYLRFGTRLSDVSHVLNCVSYWWCIFCKDVFMVFVSINFVPRCKFRNGMTHTSLFIRHNFISPKSNSKVLRNCPKLSVRKQM